MPFCYQFVLCSHKTHGLGLLHDSFDVLDIHHKLKMAQLLPLTELFPTPVTTSETSRELSWVTRSCPTVLPLTTFFTPAPDCQNHLSVLAVVPPYGTEAFLGQFAEQRSCYPSGLSQGCLNPATPMIYSPGRCPAGWTLMTGWTPRTTQSRSIAGETTHLCCER